MTKRSSEFHYYSANPGEIARHVVFSPFTWAGRRYNSDARLQAFAQHSGFDVVTTHAAGTGTPYVGRKLRKDLRCIFKIGNLAREQGEALMADSRFQDYEGYKIAQGLSGRSVWIGAMVAYLDNAGQQPFTHVQTCDGVNFSAPELSHRSVLRLLKKGGERSANLASPPNLDSRHNLLGEIYTLGCAVGEIAAYSQIMTNGDSEEPYKWLAARPEIPYHSVVFEDSVGGAQPERIAAFHERLLYLRSVAACDKEPAPLLAEALPYKHGDLMNPVLMAGLLESTVQMTDPEFKIPTQ